MKKIIFYLFTVCMFCSNTCFVQGCLNKDQKVAQSFTNFYFILLLAYESNKDNTNFDLVTNTTNSLYHGKIKSLNSLTLQNNHDVIQMLDKIEVKENLFIAQWNFLINKAAMQFQIDAHNQDYDFSNIKIQKIANEDNYLKLTSDNQKKTYSWNINLQLTKNNFYTNYDCSGSIVSNDFTANLFTDKQI